MKRLTMSRVAAARLRANKRGYLSLVIGIFLAIFMAAGTLLCLQGVLAAQLAQRTNAIGLTEAFTLDSESTEQEEKRMSTGLFTRKGRAYLLGLINDTGLMLGRYDEEGLSILNRRAQTGRLPENPGEIALEESALLSLELDAQLGGSVTLTITPINGMPETRTYTLVGTLQEQADTLDVANLGMRSGSITAFPAAMVCAQEPDFATGTLEWNTVYTARYPWSTLQLLQQTESLHHNGNDPRWNDADFRDMYFDIYVMSPGGRPTWFLGGWFDLSDTTVTLLIVVVFLGAALLITCGVGISAAVNSQLAGRAGEIGLLRSLGATKRQIRRLFGREGLLLALILSPAAIAAACGAAALLSRLAPDAMVFRLSLPTVLVMALLGFAVIALSSWLPLRRASQQMPMSVLRDTGMLRRAKGIRPRRQFNAARLMAARQLRLRPGHQLGAAFMVTLTLLCAGLFALFSLLQSSDERPYSWQVTTNPIYRTNLAEVEESLLTVSDIAQLRALPMVQRVEVNSKISPYILMDEAPAYFKCSWFGDTELWQLSLRTVEEEIAALEASVKNGYSSIPLSDIPALAENFVRDSQEQMAAFRQAFDFEGIPVHSSLAVAALDPEKLAPYVTSGTLDLDAIDRGEQVLAYYPNIYEVSMYTMSANGEPELAMTYSLGKSKDENAVLVSGNTPFSAGDTLQLMRVVAPDTQTAMNEFEKSACLKTSVTVGGVIDPEITGSSRMIQAGLSGVYEPCLLTTEKGLQAMGLVCSGLGQAAYIYTSPDLSAEAEDLLDRSIAAIADRRSGARVYNILKNARAKADRLLKVRVLFASIALMFFSVSVAMITGSISRRIQADSRTIGMLRAVGADEKTLLRCYGLHAVLSIAAGLAMSLVLWLCLRRIWQFDVMNARCLLTMPALAALDLGACLLMLRLRIRQVMKKSIVETIKEL